MIRPPRRHSCVRALASALAVALAVLLHVGAAQALIISEVLANPVGGFGSDDGLEYVELYNDGATTLTDLSGYSLGWGGGDYTFGTLDLAALGVVNLAPGDYIVIGNTASPVDFDPDLPDGFIAAAGVGLFDVPVGSIGTNNPIDAVIYTHLLGGNFNNLIDETGAVGTIDATTGAAGESIERQTLGGGWSNAAAPTPGGGSLIPEPSTALLTAVGLLLLGVRRRR